ncbi:MAG: T9SS type A sorting domain-containing protein [Candidatus Fermentibacteraceae bacterium]|nr:T9SS type A sorting domain-containing protein [Candidatus Fermentibacteraceae bacterium]MBN2608344.1 T9SS type A sorting domain-containing protein [Candidatus Fermentibacteraceae bacterium]
MERIFFLLSTVVAVASAAGSWTDTTFVAPSLGFHNTVAVFLPEGYEPGGTLDYQLLIWLHGWGSHYWNDTTALRVAHDNLVASGDIAPCIMVSPEGWCLPYEGCMWANSELYGNYEGYVVDDIITFMDTTYCTVGDQARYIMGSSMGGSGALDIALRHQELFKCVCTTAAVPDMVVCMPYVIAEVLIECPETEPPYTFDWGNGFYTDAEFMYAGGYSPNLAAPDSVDFPIDENGLLIDSVYTEWELYNAAHMVRLNPPSDLMIGLTWGLSDPQAGLVECNYAFADTLSELGLPHTVYTDNSGHGYNIMRLSQMMLIAMGWSGINEDPASASARLSVKPNPTTGPAAIGFRLEARSRVLLEVYDVSGRLVGTVLDATVEAGDHAVDFDGTGLGSGVYLLRMSEGGRISTSSLVLMDR